MKKIITIILASVLISSCSSIRYESDYLNPDLKPLLGSYLIEGECEDRVSKIYEIRVANAIHKFMANKGYHKSDNPEILIQFFIKESSISYLVNECNYYGRWAYGEQCALKAMNYEEGTIVIDIISTANQGILWHGVIKSPAFDDINNPNENINKYVNNLLSKYNAGT